MDRIDLTIPRCIYGTCTDVATHTTYKQLEFCAMHAPGSAFPAAYSACLKDGCNYKATYGLYETNVKEYCFRHYDKNIHFNLTKKGCMYENCRKLGVYKLFDKKKYCKKHTAIIDGEFVFTKSLCIISKCKRIACYGVEGGVAEFCYTHCNLDLHKCIRGRPCSDKSCKELIIISTRRCKYNHYVKQRGVYNKSKQVTRPVSSVGGIIDVDQYLL